jgi:CubicO group peptidase (beta-lactamase class C family)
MQQNYSPPSSVISNFAAQPKIAHNNIQQLIGGRIMKRLNVLLPLLIVAFFINPIPLIAQDEATARIDTFLTNLADQDIFSGAVLVARDGEILVSEGYGMANQDWDIANTAATKFRIGSVTKQFTAMSILLLQEAGKLTVQDTVCTYIEDCPEAWADVTIEHLLLHTSGIPNLTEFPDYVQFMGTRATPESTIRRFKDMPLDFEPGSQWYYSNSGYILLGYIINEVSGQLYQAFLKDNIFEPLALTGTGYDDDRRIIKNRAVGYENSTRVASFIDMSVPYSAGALYSTVGDLYTWMQVLVNGEVVPQMVLDDMWEASVPIPDAPDVKYGYGLFMSSVAAHSSIGHNGSINGFNSVLTYFPDDKITIVVLTNFENYNPQQIVDSTLNILLDES